MTEEKVKEELFKVFEYWMRGQTVGLNDDGTENFYDHDVKRFLNAINKVANYLPEFG